MEKIVLKAKVKAPIEQVWELFTQPSHVTQWNAASEDWHTTKAENDLRDGGRFSLRMEAKDGSFGFEFAGTYTSVMQPNVIRYTLDDQRKVEILFSSQGTETNIVQSFEPEQQNPPEIQQMGWQAILDNFKKYAERRAKFSAMHFKVNIDAPVDKVFKLMLDKPTYSEWTVPFNADSKYEGSWEKGSKIVFLGTDSKGETGGMVSRIKENIPNQYVSIEHIGMIRGNEEIMSGPEVESWAGCMENYSFEHHKGITLVKVDVDSTKEHTDYFEETWPEALAKLKEICER